MSAPTTIPGYQLLQRVGDLGVADVKIFQDARYFLPSEAWLRNTFAPWLKTEFWTYKRKYIREKFDCEDWTREAAIQGELDLIVARILDEARGLRVRMTVGAAVRCLVENFAIADCGCAVLEAEVLIRPGCKLNGVPEGRHATILVITPTGAFFIEPQNSLITDAQEALHPDTGCCALVWARV